MVLLQCFYVPQSFGASSEPGTASNTTGSTFIDFNSTTESSSTALKPIVDEAGLITLSLDAKGVEDYAHANIQVDKPSTGATVRSAYLATADVFGLYGGPLDNGIVQLNGVPVTWNKQVQAPNGGYNNAWADVTSIIKPIANAAPKGIINIDYTETAYLDGSILAVIFDDPAQTVNNSVVLLFGAQNMTGDTFNIGLANPVNKSDPKLAMDFSLGISYGWQPSGQVSDVSVNGKRLTSSAGGQDDGFDADGGLITVGGIGDSNANPSDPFAGVYSSCRDDDELYSLLPFINDGDTKISVDTINPSNDDNIFFAGLSVSSANAIVGEGIILDPVSDKGIIGNNHTVTATLQDDNGILLDNKDVKFNIISGPNKNKTAVVTTGSNGKASFTYTSLSTGIDTINASFTNSQGETVFSNQVQMEWSPSNNSVDFVSLNKTDTTLARGDTEQLVATVSPSNATNKNVTWVSCNPTTATVDSTGLVTAVNPGITLITVITDDGNKTATCIVRVTESIGSVESVSLNKSATTLVKGSTERLVATVSPSNAANKNVTWTSSDSSVATVDSTGLVTAVSVGTNVKITVNTTDGNKQAYCYITVTENTASHLEYPESVSVTYGKTQAVKIYEVQSDDTKVDVTKEVTLVADDPATATITRGVIKGISVGDTVVRGTYQGLDIEISVTVTPPVTKLTADPSVLNLSIGGTDAITLTAIYKDGTEADVIGSSATWKSSKPQFATVDADGNVTGEAIGSTTITGAFGGKTATITVNVIPELDHILIQPGNVGVAKGKTQIVTIYAIYVDGSKVDITKTIRLKSDDTTVATVSGVIIKGIKPDCDTVVRGTYLDQDIEIPVKVTQPLKKLETDCGTTGLNLTIGESETITLTATYADGTSEEVNECATASSSKPSVAAVVVEDESITVTGVRAGSATIAMSYEGKKITAKINVTA